MRKYPRCLYALKYLVGFGFVVILMLKLMLNDIITSSIIKRAKTFGVLQSLRRTSKANFMNPINSMINDYYQAPSDDNRLENINYPGDVIPESQLKKSRELSHGILKRKLSQEEYKNYKLLISEVIEIFDKYNIR